MVPGPSSDFGPSFESLGAAAVVVGRLRLETQAPAARAMLLGVRQARGDGGESLQQQQPLQHKGHYRTRACRGSGEERVGFPG